MPNNIFAPIEEKHIAKAIERIEEEGYPTKRKSSQYDLVHKGITYPPKYVMSLGGYFANGNFLSHKLFHGGPEHECFKVLKSYGYKILSKEETENLKKAEAVPEDIHLKYTYKYVDTEKFKKNYFQDKFEEYYSFCKRSQWLKSREAYKFKFAKWLTEKVNFKNQNDDEILELCKESQNQKYSEGNEKGINFITSSLRYQDDFISLHDIRLLRKLKEGGLLEYTDLETSPLSFPKFSCWAGTLIPEDYRIYANEELTTGLISLFEIDEYPKIGIRSFNLANSCLKIVSEEIRTTFAKEMKGIISMAFEEEVSFNEAYLSWLTQDFILFLTRKVENMSRNYYWVNQGKQYDEELENSCITAPDDNIYHHKKLKELQEGDIVINYSGTYIRAISEVVREFQIGERAFRPDGERHITVWLKYNQLDEPISLNQVQEKFRKKEHLLPKTHSPFNSSMNVNQAYLLNFTEDAYNTIFSDEEINLSQVSEEDSSYGNNSKERLNQILFGPPGTGKTYNTINRALEICGVELPAERQDAIYEFDKLVAEKRIVFTTFHQSMTYEDFIEGIKPQEPAQEGHPVIFKIEPGIFKRIAVNAAFALAEKNSSTETENVLDFSMAFDKFKDDVEERLSKQESVELDTKNGGKVIVDSISQQGNFNLKHPGRDLTYTVSKSRLSKLNNGLPNLEEVKNIDSEFREIIGGSNSTVNWAVLNEIRNQYLHSLTSTTKERVVDWEDKYEVVKKLKKSDYKGKKGDPYVLIIDEINRGNVSAIFGELITLIEDDKRLGREEGLVAQLPYSKDIFGVPPNLYIVGTMNTADRSVEALDTALRRRFNFEEMPPKFEKIKEGNGLTEIEEIKLANLLKKINMRIERLLDKDHMIGHSFFMNLHSLKDLKLVFHNKILPLLQEYFFGDFGKIGLVLGRGFFEVNEPEEDLENIFADFDYENGFNERPVYHLKNVEQMSNEDFIIALRS